MSNVQRGRTTVQFDGDFVVFLIGMRINRPWMVHKWLPVFIAMPRMLKELSQHPAIGCLGYEMSLKIIVQYWRSFDHLEAYARSREHEHWPAWVEFNRKVKASSGDVGIWHETYLVRAGEFEAIYGSMPPFGLGRVGRLVPASGTKEEARGRVSRPDRTPQAASVMSQR